MLSACSYDVFMDLQGFSSFAVGALLEEDLFVELPCVCMAGVTLDQVAKDFALVLQHLSGVEEWWDSVGNCTSFPMG